MYQHGVHCNAILAHSALASLGVTENTLLFVENRRILYDILRYMIVYNTNNTITCIFILPSRDYNSISHSKQENLQWCIC